MNKKILIGHISAETAFEQQDYPYGRLRCNRKIWVETKPKVGQRIMTQTQNPKNGKWNAPKASTYNSLVVLYLDLENNHVEYASLSGYDSLEKIEAFEKEYAEGLTDKRSVNVLEYMKAAHRAMSKVTWEVRRGPLAEGEKPQTEKEQQQILQALTLQELAESKKKK